MGVVCGVLGAGCFSPPPEAEARLAALKRENDALNASLDTVEERLLGNQAGIHLWTELARRHQQVSAVACTVADGHLRGMAANLDRQQQKARALRRTTRVASATVSAVRARPAPRSKL